MADFDEGPFERDTRFYTPLANALGTSLSGLAKLPEKLMNASEERRMGGDYDPAPAVELMKRLYGINSPFTAEAVLAKGATKLAPFRSAQAAERPPFDEINELQEAQLRKLGESALKRGLSDAEPTYRMLADLLSGRIEGYSPEQLAHAKEIFREVSESEESKKLRAAHEALKPKIDPIQELLKRNEKPDPRYRAPGYFPRKDILMGRLSPEETQIGPQSSPNSLGTQLAMADDPASRTKPLFEVGGGRGGGFSGGNSVPVRTYQTQLSSEGLTPAVKVGSKVFEGSNHPDAIKNAERGLGGEFYDLTGGLDGMRAAQGFTTGKGRFLTREQAGKLYGVTKTGE